MDIDSIVRTFNKKVDFYRKIRDIECEDFLVPQVISTKNPIVKSVIKYECTLWIVRKNKREKLASFSKAATLNTEVNPNINEIVEKEIKEAFEELILSCLFELLNEENIHKTLIGVYRNGIQ